MLVSDCLLMENSKLDSCLGKFAAQQSYKWSDFVAI